MKKQQNNLSSCQTYMRLCLIIAIIILLASCRRSANCDNATVRKSGLCGIDWEVEYEGKRYPVQNLPDDLKRDKNSIFISSHHFYTDPAICACCGYTYIVIDQAFDEVICL